MTRRSALAAALTWAAILCSLLAIAGPHGVGAVGRLDVWALAAVAAVAVAVTLGITATRWPAIIGYLVVHLLGALVVVVSEGLRPPWAWQPLGTLWPHAGLALNPASIALLSTALTWELSYAATWMVLRERRAWLALALVVGTLALGSARALRQPDTAVMALTAAGLAVAAAAAALERAARMPRQVHSASGARSAPLYWAPVCALLLVVAWAAPSVTAPPAAHGGLAGWTAPLAALARHLGLTSREAGDTSAGLTHAGSAVAVGGVFNPDGSLVFSARVADPTRWPYWRGAVYDLYQQGAWRAVPGHNTLTPAGVPIARPPSVSPAAVITQSITLLRPLNTLVTAGMPLTASVAVDVTLSNRAPAAGPLALLPPHGAANGTYTAASLVASTLPISPAPLLDPAVRAVDLALPPLPARVGALARSLTAGSRDPYVQAWAIQRYLRGAGSRYVYDPSPPQAPVGQDPTDYFLFQSRHGFCTHFASAMVVLARLAGIPARLVTGYAATHLTPGGFLVTTADAHAWPELWIAGRGWLTFEPTPQFHTPFQTGGPPVPATTPATTLPTATAAVATSTAQPRQTATPSATARPTETATAHAAATTPGQRGAPTAPAGSGGAGLPHVSVPFQPILAAVAVVLALGLILLLLAPGDVPALYRRMCRLAALLHAGPRAGQTPLEWARRVAAQAPGDSAAVLEITGLYVRQRYGNYRPVRADLRLARASLRRVQRRWLWRLVTRRGL